MTETRSLFQYPFPVYFHERPIQDIRNIDRRLTGLTVGNLLLSETRRAHEVRAAEVRAVESRVGESRVDERRVGEVCFEEARGAEVCADEECVVELCAPEIKFPEVGPPEAKLEILLLLVRSLSLASFRNHLQCSENVRALDQRWNNRQHLKPRIGTRRSLFLIGRVANELGQHLHDRDVISLDRILGYASQGVDRPDTRAWVFFGGQHFNRVGIAVSYLALLNHIYLTLVYTAPPNSNQTRDNGNYGKPDIPNDFAAIIQVVFLKPVIPTQKREETIRSVKERGDRSVGDLSGDNNNQRSPSVLANKFGQSHGPTQPLGMAGCQSRKQRLVRR